MIGEIVAAASEVAAEEVAVSEVAEATIESGCLDVSTADMVTETANEQVFCQTAEITLEKQGGSYKEVKQPGEGAFKEVHHAPADSASKLERDDGPAIKMDIADHRQTASFGSSREAREYRAQQKELIDNGKFREALHMDIDDIHEKFGDKYDEAISQMLEYVDKLEAEGTI